MLPQQFEKITTEGVRGMILARFDTGPLAWVDAVSMRMTTSQAAETYTWLGTAPPLREFIAGREVKELREVSWVVTNKDYESSLRIKSKDMRRDKLGMIDIRVNQLTDRLLDHPAKLISTLLLNGASALCYDGQYFFDTDHAEGDSGTLSNSISFAAATGTTPTVEEMGGAILAAIAQMMTFKDDRGEPMNQSASKFLVMVPVTYLAVALQAVTALLVGGGNTNVLPALKGRFDVEVAVNPRLTWTDKFVVFRTDDAAKPIILQEEDIPDVIALGEGSEYEQLNKECIFGVDWSGNVAYGYWQHAVLVTIT